MPIPLDNFDTGDGYPRRGRGGFMRNAQDQALIKPPGGGRMRIYKGASNWWPWTEPYGGDPVYGDRGTHIHDICDLADRGLPLDGGWTAHGEGLGIPTDLQAYIYDRWLAFKKAHGIEVVYVEQPYVNDTLKVASNADRIFRFQRRPHRLFVGDIKTASEFDKIEYAVQAATLVGSVPYDVYEDERYEWPAPINPARAYIFWFPIGKARTASSPAELPDWSLVKLDIRPHVRACRTLAAIRDRTCSKDFEIVEPPAPVDPKAEERRRNKLRDVYLTKMTPAEQAAFVAAGVDMDDLDAVEAAINQVMSIDHTAELATRQPVHETPAPERLAATKDEGDKAADSAVATLKTAYDGLDESHRNWISDISGDAYRAGAGLNVGERQSIRRFEIMRGLIMFAIEYGVPSDSDEVVGDLLTAALEVAHGQPIGDRTPGQILATFGVEAATTFARTIGDLIDGSAHVTYDDDSRPTITRRPAA